jgi:hypothetical protein
MDKNSEEIHWLTSPLEIMIVPHTKLTGPHGYACMFRWRFREGVSL